MSEKLHGISEKLHVMPEEPDAVDSGIVVGADGSDHGRAAQILGHGVAAHADHGRDLMPAMAADMFETKDFSYLTHWQSLAWHDAPRIAGETPCRR